MRREPGPGCSVEIGRPRGFQPVRLRVGLNYEDDCLDLGVSWKRDYERIGDFRKGSTLSFNISLKGLGR